MKKFLGFPYMVDKVMDTERTYRLFIYPTRQSYIVLRFSKPRWWR